MLNTNTTLSFLLLCSVSWFCLFIWLPWVLAVAWGIFSYGLWTLSSGMWDLAPRPWVQSEPPALGAQSLSHWTTREVPQSSPFIGFLSLSDLGTVDSSYLRSFSVFSDTYFSFLDVVQLFAVSKKVCLRPPSHQSPEQKPMMSF